MSNHRFITVIVPGKNGQKRDVLVPIEGVRPTPPWLFAKLVSRGDLKPGKKYLLTGNATVFLYSDEPLEIFEPDPRIQLNGHCGAYRTAPA